MSPYGYGKHDIVHAWIIPKGFRLLLKDNLNIWIVIILSFFNNYFIVLLKYPEGEVVCE